MAICRSSRSGLLMSLALSYDHRVIDCKEAGRFGGGQESLEDPPRAGAWNCDRTP